MYRSDLQSAVWAALVLSCHIAQASSRAQLGVKRLIHIYQSWIVQSCPATVPFCRQGTVQAGHHACSGHVHWGMRFFFPSCFSSPFSLQSYCRSTGPPSGPESKSFPTMPLNWCSGDLGSALSGFCRLAPWCWAPLCSCLSQFLLPALDLLHIHHMLPATYWGAMQSRE